MAEKSEAARFMHASAERLRGMAGSPTPRSAELMRMAREFDIEAEMLEQSVTRDPPKPDT